MSIWVWIVIAVLIVAAAILIAALAVGRRKRTVRLKERFGPEYERTVATAGAPAAAEKELMARERQHDKLDIRDLSPEAQQGFARRWHGVQSGFVDDPATALAEADRLVNELMNARGYPMQDFEQRAADISVDHPAIVQNYRAAHAITHTQHDGEVQTEARRQAFVHYRALFDALLSTPDTRDDHGHADRTTTPRHATTFTETPS